jgi:Domain of unknown function (DUF3850)
MKNSHDVKSWPRGFRAVLGGRKRFEVRRDDRSPPFASGDTITLHEFDPEAVEDGPRGYTGRRASFLIGYVQRGAPMPPGWCAFELVAPEEAQRVGVALGLLAL